MEQLTLDNIKVGDIAPTKFSIDLMADSIVEQVKEGNLQSLDVAIKMNAMEQLVKAVKERMSKDVIDELLKYPKGKAEVNGAAISIMETVKYDYTHLEEWNKLEAEIAILEEKQKEIEDYEKKYHRGDLPIKSSSTTFKVQLSK